MMIQVETRLIPMSNSTRLTSAVKLRQWPTFLRVLIRAIAVDNDLALVGATAILKGFVRSALGVHVSQS